MGVERLSYATPTPGRRTLTFAAGVGVAMSMLIALAAAAAVPVLLTVGTLLVFGTSPQLDSGMTSTGIILLIIGVGCGVLSVQLIAHANRLLKGR